MASVLTAETENKGHGKEYQGLRPIFSIFKKAFLSFLI